MNPGSPELERLISRFLDDESTPDERRRLRALERSDPHVTALVDEYAALDREVGQALRTAMGRTYRLGRARSPWSRAGQFVGLAAAACVAAMLWLTPARNATPGGARQPAQGASWFAPAAWQADVQERTNPSYERPQVRLRDTDRDWIIVPGNRPGEFMVIEVNRVRTRAVAIQNDF